MLKTPELFHQGYHLDHFHLPEEISELIDQKDWVKLDKICTELTSPGGSLFEFVKSFHDFSTIETMISLRSSMNDWEEDGIWHDDGTRVFAFSLSLTKTAHSLKGGKLGIRLKNAEEASMISTPDFGGIILFLTGIHGYEHRIHRVEEGERIILVGWCL